jgi:uncharacterized protein YicC (UPF0701 family)
MSNSPYGFACNFPVSSMTGFARVAVEVNAQLSYVLTLKSVNHRFLDLHLRLPSVLMPWRWSCAGCLRSIFGAGTWS